MDHKLLQEIGLSEGEAKVYLALLRLGSTKTGALAKEASVSSSKVYKILDRLMKKGLAGFVKKGDVKFYNALEPKRVLEFIDEKEAELKKKKELIRKILPDLELESRSNKKSIATLYEGTKGIMNFYRNILYELKRGEQYYVIGAGYGTTPSIMPFFESYHRDRIKKGIIVNMLANHDTKETLVPPTRIKSKVRFLPQYLFTNMTILFYREKVFIIIWTKEPTAVLITSKDAVKSFKAYFDTFWRIAK